jgi:GDP-L-fucose synthase
VTPLPLAAEGAAEGIVLAIERYNGGEPVNLGTGEEISIRDLAQMIAGEVGFPGSIVWDTMKPNGQPRRCLDTSRALQYFGFRAQCGLREGIAKTSMVLLIARTFEKSLD